MCLKASLEVEVHPNDYPTLLNPLFKNLLLLWIIISCLVGQECLYKDLSFILPFTDSGLEFIIRPYPVFWLTKAHCSHKPSSLSPRLGSVTSNLVIKD